MKKLFTAATVVFALSLLACGGNNTKSPKRLVTIETATAISVAAPATPTSTTDVDVSQPEACHIGRTNIGREILFEDSQVCIIRDIGTGSYSVLIPFVSTIDQYRVEKEIAESKIRSLIPEKACKFNWGTSAEVKNDLVLSDYFIEGCPLEQVGK